MIDALYGNPLKTPEQYFEEYMRELVDKVKQVGKIMDISRHPAIIQQKLKEVNETHFGYDFFGFK